MRRVLIAAVAVLCVVSAGGIYPGSVRLQADQVQADQAAKPVPPQMSGVYERHCAGCHGGDMTGAKGGAIQTWVRFHVDNRDCPQGASRRSRADGR